MRYQLMTDNELLSLAKAGNGTASQVLFERQFDHTPAIDNRTPEACEAGMSARDFAEMMK